MVKTTLAEYQGEYEAPKFTYEPVDISLIPPRKRDYTSKSKGGKMMANNQSVKETPEELRHTDEQHNQETTHKEENTRKNS